METRYKIVVVFSVVFMVTLGFTSGTTCIFVDGETPDWLGSDNGCGPWITYEIQKHLGIFW